MNVTENYLLKQMQNLAAAMSGVPQMGSKDKTSETGSFQEMLDQAGKTGGKEKPGVKETEETESKQPLEEKEAQPGEAPEETEEPEELKPEQLTANPNAVVLLDLFRPDMVQAAGEETVVEVPVEAIGQEAVEAPDLALDGQMAEMETGVEADVSGQAPMEQQPQSFRSAMEETVPQERQEQPVETAPQPAAEAPEAAPQQVQSAEKPRTEDAPKLEAEVQTEAVSEEDGEPKAESAQSQQPVFREMDSTPVKVGETYEPRETVDTQEPGMEQKLANTIRMAAQTGQERIQIHLAPQNLGSLTIEMTKDASGALQVVLHTSSAKAAGVLNQHMDGLQAALRGYSQEEVRIEVQRNEESQQQHFRQADPDGRGSQQHQQQGGRREEKHTGEAFMQKLRLGLFGADEA